MPSFNTEEMKIATYRVKVNKKHVPLPKESVNKLIDAAVYGVHRDTNQEFVVICPGFYLCQDDLIQLKQTMKDNAAAVVTFNNETIIIQTEESDAVILFKIIGGSAMGGTTRAVASTNHPENEEATTTPHGKKNTQGGNQEAPP